MSVYFVRHGESLANVNGTAAGAEDDSPLAENGLRDAQTVAREIMKRITTGELHINKIVSSLLQRVRQTAEIISHESLGDLPVEIDQRWRERGIGKAAGMKHGTWYHLVVSHNGVYRALQTHIHHVSPEKFVEMPGLGNGEIVEIIKQGESDEWCSSDNDHQE